MNSEQTKAYDSDCSGNTARMRRFAIKRHSSVPRCTNFIWPQVTLMDNVSGRGSVMSVFKVALTLLKRLRCHTTSGLV